MRGSWWHAIAGGESRLRRSLFYCHVESIVATASENLGVIYLPLFAVAMGASPVEVSLLTAIPAFMANALQLPFGRLAERTGRKKRLWLLGNSVARLMWLPIALVPWVVHERSHQIQAVLALAALRGLGLATGIPAWTALMGELTHRSWRGSYFAVRLLLANLGALLASVAGGYLVKAFGYPVGYAVAFGAALGIGLFSLLVILPVHEPRKARRTRPHAEAVSVASPAGAPATAPTGSPTGPRGVVTPGAPGSGSPTAAAWLAGGPQAWRREAPGFYEYAVAAFLWNVAVNLPMALFPIYFTQNLRGTAELWGLANGVMFVTTILGQRQWGVLADRVGNRPIMVWSGMWAAVMPIWWAIIPGPAWVVLINVIGGFVWAGYNLGAFNLVLEVTPEQRRPSYVSLFNLGVGVAASVTPILGGWMAEHVGISPVMVGSGILRLAAVAVFARWSGVPFRPWPARSLLQGGLAERSQARPVARAARAVARGPR